ncbi:MAG: hypothetical protein NC343_04095 [Muribaculum sp.]|nr:hypothetical protein [Muribaculaceae bacterium]MCM1080911.1 hypothetical protein [Muribaculum sp.]
MEFRKYIQSLINNNDCDSAIVELTDKIDSTDAEAWMLVLRGKLYWRRGKVREAMNDYYAADLIEPDGEAACLLENAQAIMQFRCTDLLNP